MFESSLLDALRTDSALSGLITAFNGAPAVFSDAAPDKAELPYVVFSISRTSTEAAAVHKFDVMIHVYGYGATAKAARDAAERIENLLDRGILQHERYSCIRLFMQSGGLVDDDTDPRSIHQNMLFIARAGRKKWVEEMTTLGY
jgi:hypothetical protein